MDFNNLNTLIGTLLIITALLDYVIMKAVFPRLLAKQQGMTPEKSAMVYRIMTMGILILLALAAFILIVQPVKVVAV